jgi:riboflavin kinase / FMN adenylyltransferase
VARIVRYIQDLRDDERGAVIALGNFDGIHLGHQKLLAFAREIADREGRKLMIMSFYPHPLTFFKGTKNIQIQLLQDKIKLIDELGVDIVFLKHFTAEFANLNAIEFLEEFLLKGLGIKYIVAGHDFIFGKNRSGSVALLAEEAKQQDFSFTQLQLQSDDQTGEVYSSSKIRDYLAQGQVVDVKTLLGRHYSVTGRVRRGRQEGEALGFKTANLVLPHLYKMKYGVYAAYAYISGGCYKAVVNFGIRPSFNLGDQAVFEAHIFGLDKNIYGKKLKIEFIAFLREEKKFASITELTKQIENDCKNAKSILEN